MSTNQIIVSKVDAIFPHTNADRLEIAHIGGWQVVVQKGMYNPGDKCVYFPPDSLLKQEVSDRFGVTKYLSRGRVKAAKLRGESSFGFVVKPEEDWPVGYDLTSFYQVERWNPPENLAGDLEKPNDFFHRYTDIENLRNYPTILDGEDVVVTEKIHGSNVRVGLCYNIDSISHKPHVEVCVGTKNTRQKEFNAKGNKSPYWKAWYEATQNLLESFLTFKQSVILFGELYGPGVQNMTYGLQNSKVRFFDIAVDGYYLDANRKLELFKQYLIPHAPVLYQGQFNLDKILELTSGNSLTKEADTKYNFREGVVVTTTTEKSDPKIGRKILKSISIEYLENVS